MHEYYSKIHDTHLGKNPDNLKVDIFGEKLNFENLIKLLFVPSSGSHTKNLHSFSKRESRKYFFFYFFTVILRRFCASLVEEPIRNRMFNPNLDGWI